MVRFVLTGGTAPSSLRQARARPRNFRSRARTRAFGCRCRTSLVGKDEVYALRRNLGVIRAVAKQQFVPHSSQNTLASHFWERGAALRTFATFAENGAAEFMTSVKLAIVHRWRISRKSLDSSARSGLLLKGGRDFVLRVTPSKEARKCARGSPSSLSFSQPVLVRAYHCGARGVTKMSRLVKPTRQRLHLTQLNAPTLRVNTVPCSVGLVLL